MYFCGWICQSVEIARVGFAVRVSSSVLSPPTALRWNQALSNPPTPSFFFLFSYWNAYPEHCRQPGPEKKCGERQDISLATPRVKSLEDRMLPVRPSTWTRGRPSNIQDSRENVSLPVYENRKIVGLLLTAAITWHLEGSHPSYTNTSGFVQSVIVMLCLDSRMTRITSHRWEGTAWLPWAVSVINIAICSFLLKKTLLL